VEGYEGVEALVRGRPPQTPPVCQGRTLKPAVDVLDVDGGGGGGGLWCIYVTIQLYSISRECRL